MDSNENCSDKYLKLKEELTSITEQDKTNEHKSKILIFVD